MKHRIPLAAASLAVLGSVLVSAPAHAHSAPDADGDHRPCVTVNEWKRVDAGATKTRVRHVFDTRGHEADRRTANSIYNDLAYYGVPLQRLPMRYREVRVYPVCADGRISSGVVVTLFDRRGHRQVVSEYETSETSRQSVGMIELPPVPPPATPDPESPNCSRCG